MIRSQPSSEEPVFMVEPSPMPPDVSFNGALWSGDALADTAAAWHARIAALRDAVPDAVGVVMQNHPESFALLFALSALPVPVVLLHADPTTWRSAPPFPRSMPTFLSPASAHFRAALEAAGLPAVVLPEAAAPARLPRPRFFTTPGFVLFTSGSTGEPKPTFRSVRGLLQTARVIASAYTLPAGVRVAGCLPLATSFGLAQTIVLPAVLGGHVSLLERFDHRSLLNLFARERFDYWPGTALMADLLVRAPLGDWSGQAPTICHLSSGHLAEPVFRRFLERFGVPLRQSYGRTECSFITSERAPAEDIRPETVGTASPGVELRCGETPDQPEAAGSPGRIWIRCPWHSEGYGYPPHLSPIARPDGWCATEDLGTLTADGRLVILGRIDDCFKTTGGFLVSPALIGGALRGDAGVVDAAVVPVTVLGSTGIGIVAVTRGATGLSRIHDLARRALPAWLHPAVVAIRPEIPCLPTGKHDRAACIRLLEAEMRRRRAEGPP
jgi:long-chain acyl-CoA synthetase